MQAAMAAVPPLIENAQIADPVRRFLEYVLNKREQGNPVVGVYCGYAPVELIRAMGAVPVSLCSASQWTIPAAEAILRRMAEEEGVDLSRVCIGHSGDTADLEYLQRLIDKGSLLGMDRFGMDALLPFDRRVDTVARLCARGYADRMVLSHDAACYIDWLPEGAPQRSAPNWHFLHICRDVLPALAERGVSASQIRTMLVENPRRFLENPA